jgi:hypothetical protein
MSEDFRREINIGDIILVERVVPIFLPSHYEARVIFIGPPDEYAFRTIFKVKPIHGLFRRPRWVVGLWIKAVTMRKEVAELERMIR